MQKRTVQLVEKLFILECLEYQVPLTSIGPVVTAAIQELGGQIIDHLPDPSSFSYIPYEIWHYQ